QGPAGARQVVLLPRQAGEDSPAAGRHLAAKARDVAAAVLGELLGPAPEPGLGRGALVAARRGEPRLVLAQAALDAPATNLHLAAELLHVRSARIFRPR